MCVPYEAGNQAQTGVSESLCRRCRLITPLLCQRIVYLREQVQAHSTIVILSRTTRWADKDWRCAAICIENRATGWTQVQCGRRHEHHRSRAMVAAKRMRKQRAEERRGSEHPLMVFWRRHGSRHVGRCQGAKVLLFEQDDLIASTQLCGDTPIRLSTPTPVRCTSTPLLERKAAVIGTPCPEESKALFVVSKAMALPEPG